MRILPALLLCAAAAAAQERERVDLAAEADLHFELGTERFRAHDYRAALEHFLFSNRLVPNRNVVFDIAETYAQLKQFPEAYRAYNQALEGEADAKERARIEKALQRVAGSVAVLRVRTEPPGATLYVDRKDLGARGSSPAVLAFAAGTYRVLAELPGYEAAVSDPISARPGSDATVSLVLRRLLRPVRALGQPVGAEVRAETGERCALPCELQLPIGKATLTASAPGFVRGKQDVYVGDATEPVEFDLPHETGRLIVNTDERGAAVQIDGKLAGFTPAVIEAPVGQRNVRITAPGFEPIERTVEVTRGEQPPLEMQLVAVEEVSAASRTAESVDDAPGSVSVIGSRELRAMGYPTIADALRGLRGVFINDDTTYKSIGFRGYGPAGSYGNKVLILVDGHSTNDDWIGSSYVGVDNRTDLDDFERIEVVRGPGSVLYGTGAFLGVVNLVTRPREAPSDASATIGTIEGGAVRARGNLRRVFGESAGMDLSASGLSSSGQDYLFPDPVGPSRGADGMRAGTVSGKIWTGAFTLQAQATARDKALPAGEYTTLVGDPRTHLIDRRAFAEARFEPKLGDTADLLLRANWDRYTYDSWLQFSSDNGGLSRERFFGDWAGGEARISLHPSPLFRVMAGGEGQWHFHVSQNGVSGVDQGTPQTYLNSQNNFDTYAAYLVADFKPTERIHLSAGARLDTYSTFGSSVNPRLTLIVKPTSADVVKLMAGTAFRAPSVYELYYNDGGRTQLPASPCATDPCLRPETIRSGEVEVTHHFPSLWTAVGSVSASDISDVIELRNAPGQTDKSMYQNVAVPVRALGFEAELRREWRQGWMAAATYAFTHVTYQSGDLRNVPNSPEHLGSLKIAVPVVQRALTAMTRVSVEGPRWDRNASPGDPPQQQTGSAVIWDLVLSGDLPEWHLRYSLGLYNLADWKYEVPVSPEFSPLLTMPQKGRSVLSSLTLSL